MAIATGAAKRSVGAVAVVCFGQYSWFPLVTGVRWLKEENAGLDIGLQIGQVSLSTRIYAHVYLSLSCSVAGRAADLKQRTMSQPQAGSESPLEFGFYHLPFSGSDHGYFGRRKTLYARRMDGQLRVLGWPVGVGVLGPLHTRSTCGKMVRMGRRQESEETDKGRVDTARCSHEGGRGVGFEGSGERRPGDGRTRPRREPSRDQALELVPEWTVIAWSNRQAECRRKGVLCFWHVV